MTGSYDNTAKVSGKGKEEGRERERGKERKGGRKERDKIFICIIIIINFKTDLGSSWLDSFKNTRRPRK